MAAEKLDHADDEAALPLIEEAPRAGKRRVETGRARVPVAAGTEGRPVRETPRTERAGAERLPAPPASGRGAVATPTAGQPAT